MKMTLGKKISLAFGALIALALALGAVSIADVSRFDSAFQSVDAVSLPGTIQLAQLSRAAAEEETDMLKHVLAAGTAEVQAQRESDLAGWESRFQSGLGDYGSKLADASGREAFGQIRQAHERVMEEWSGTILPLSRANNAKDASAKWSAEMVPDVEAEQQAIAGGIEDHRRNAARMAGAAAAIGQSARFWSILLLILVVGGGAGLAYGIVRGLKRVLVKLVNDLGRGAGQVASAAGQISSSSQALAQGTAEQAASLEQTSASTEEMTSMTRKNAENAEDCAKLMAAVDARIAEANQT
ncbi:MAG: MCP four helix bundle domain-containing protein, partial [Bryobacteraceae bacterium]